MRCARSSPYEFHHQRAYAARIFQAVDVRDVRMVQCSERLRLASEPRQAIGIAGEGVRKDLDRNLSLQLRVGRSIHQPHAAFADLGGDFVDAEASAGSKGQV